MGKPLVLDSLALNDPFKSAISFSRSFKTSCRRTISFSRLAALLPLPPVEPSTPFGSPVGLGTEIEGAGREEKELEGECETGPLLPWLLENEGLCIWLTIAPARVTCMKGFQKLMRNPAPFDGASERTANLEWRDSAEAVCMKKRRRFPEFSLVFLADFLLAVWEHPLREDPRIRFFPEILRQQGLERVWLFRAGSIFRRASRYLAVTVERSARIAVWVCWRATS